MNLKPFNLEEALANPERVITRDGRKVNQLTKFDIPQDFCLAGVIDDDFYTFTCDGSFDEDEERDYDLFLLPQTKTVWVVITISIGNIINSYAFETEERANYFYSQRIHNSYSKPTPIEIEI